MTLQGKHRCASLEEYLLAQSGRRVFALGVTVAYPVKEAGK